jgi:hypothetical protein
MVATAEAVTVSDATRFDTDGSAMTARAAGRSVVDVAAEVCRTDWRVESVGSCWLSDAVDITGQGAGAPDVELGGGRSGCCGGCRDGKSGGDCWDNDGSVGDGGEVDRARAVPGVLVMAVTE